MGKKCLRSTIESHTAAALLLDGTDRNGVRGAPAQPPTHPPFYVSDAWTSPLTTVRVKQESGCKAGKFPFVQFSGVGAGSPACRRAPRAAEGRPGGVVGRCLTGAKRREFGRRRLDEADAETSTPCRTACTHPGERHQSRTVSLKRRARKPVNT